MSFVKLMSDRELYSLKSFPCAYLRGSKSYSIVGHMKRKVQQDELKALLLSTEILLASKFRELIRAAENDSFSDTVAEQVPRIS